MKVVFWVSLFGYLVLVLNSSYAQKSGLESSLNTVSQVSYEKTLAMFMKAEKRALAWRDSMENKKFEPHHRFTNLMNIFKKEAPYLFANPDQHFSSLLKILKATNVNEDQEFYLDIIRLLYPICIEQYAEVVHIIHGLYKERIVDGLTLSMAAFPDFQYCSNVYENRENSKFKSEIQQILNTLSTDNSKEANDIKSHLQNLYDGTEDEMYIQFTQIGLPYLSYQKCQSE